MRRVFLKNQNLFSLQVGKLNMYKNFTREKLFEIYHKKEHEKDF